MHQLTESTTQAIITIAIGYWMDKGRTQEEIDEVIKTEEGMKLFLTPAIKIYPYLSDPLNYGSVKK